MDALDLLHERIDIIKLMEHYNFDHMAVNEPYVRSCCAIHGGNNSTGFVANVENGRWFCHTGGCGGGDAFTLVQVKEKLAYPQAVKWLANFFGVDIGDVRLLKRKSEEEAELKRWLKAVRSRGYVQQKDFELPELPPITQFRNFLPDTLKHFALKYAETYQAEKRDGGTYTLNKRILFPIELDGRVIGASLRRIRKADIPKWSHQPASLLTSHILYNYDAITNDVVDVCVVEGIPDVWAYHEIGIVAVCTFGAHLTNEQYKMLLRTGKDITLSFDGDESGRIATQKAYDLMKLTTNLTRVHFEEGEDPANLTREELLIRYEQRI